MPTRPTLSVSALLLALALHTPLTAVAQPSPAAPSVPATPAPPATSAIPSALANARRAYERDMANVRASVGKTIDEREAKLRAAQPLNRDAIEAVKSERVAFATTGAWPSTGVDKQREAAAAAAAALIKAYNSTKDVLVKGGTDAAADAIDAERVQFESQSDLNAWSANLLEGKEGSARSVTMSDAVQVSGLPTTEYRVEIVAKRTSGEGPLMMRLPLPGGGRVALKAVPDSTGQVRALVSLRKPLVSLDLGAERVTGEAPDAGTDSILTLQAPSGAFQVESVKAKPILAGRPEAVTPKVAKPSAPPRENDKEKQPLATAGLAKGSRWRGPHDHGGRKPETASLRIVDAREDRIIANIDWPHGNSRQFEFSVRGKAFVLTDITVLGDGQVTYHDESGSAELHGDTLVIRYTARTGKNNEKKTGTLTLKRE